MSPFISKMKLRILSRRIKGFWEEYRRNKIGLVGMAIILMFVIAGILAPIIAPYTPQDSNLAAAIAIPEWLKVFPQYSDLPSTYKSEINFTAEETNNFINVTFKDHDPEIYKFLKKSAIRMWTVTYQGNNKDPLEVKLFWNFTYSYQPPPVIGYSFRWRAINLSNIEYNLELCLVRWGNESAEYSLWDSNMGVASPLRNLKYRSTVVSFPKPPVEPYVYSNHNSSLARLGAQLGLYGNITSQSILKIMFSEKGEYGLVMHIRLKPKSTNAKCEISIIDPEFVWLGSVHGILGTDNDGGDVFSKLIYGIQVSLSIGLMVALISTAIGTLVGVTSGYLGGLIDEASMRIVDLLLCLPVLPLLITFTVMFGRQLYLIMLFLVFLSWMGLSRAIRAQVLSMREMAFVESAIASGASKGYLLLRHIIPNIMPLAFTSMMLFIPGAVLAEATLSFLGFGDPTLMTWGRMINTAYAQGAFPRLAWWWIFSPAVAIMLLCAGFVFMSHALDQILNPRLRRRR
jgi:ABC-type dipeptide/oligopeptide/nickel transport system permease subunit